MSVFLSWSGPRGRQLASATSQLLRATVPQARPWMSTDIRRGSPWAIELLASLRDAKVGVLCLTSDSVGSPWIQFEAGAILGVSRSVSAIASLAFDVPADRFRTGALSRYSTFACEAEPVRELLDLVARTEGADSLRGEAFDQAWHAFRIQIGQIPDLLPVPFDLVRWRPDGLLVTRVDLDADIEWSALLEALFPDLPPERWSGLRYLDLEGHRWIPTPRRAADITLPRIVALHPDLDSHYLASAALAGSALSQSLDVIPTETRARATLRRDLDALVASQDNYVSEHGSYAATLEQLDFHPAFGNEIEIVSGPNGWAAKASRPESAVAWGVRIGDGAGNFADREEAAVFALY
ncbi:MAG: TIR domain-containing protein [Thermoleophilia bacterium]